MSRRDGGFRYQYAGAAIVRATTCPPGLVIPEDVGAGGDPERSASWLAEIWARPDVRDALRLASPALARDLDQIAQGVAIEARQLRRVIPSLASYLLRWQGRPTPFGLFAGVAPLGVAASASADVRWGGAHRTSARADAAWLGEIIDRLERQPEVLDRLTVIANSAASVRDDRIVIPGPPPAGPGRAVAPLEAAARLTRPVRAALTAAQCPVTVTDLVKQLAVEFPAASLARIRDLVAELVREGLS